MKKTSSIVLIVLYFIFTSLSSFSQIKPYQDPTLTIEQRLDDLLSRMTFDEKVAQINMKSLSKLQVDSLGNITDSSLRKLFKGESTGCLESPFIHLQLDEIDFTLWDKNMQRIVEPEEFEIMIGKSSEKIELTKIIVLR